MADEVNFNDLIALSKIGADTTVEKYGGVINSSLFDSANVLGALSGKNLITFTTSLAGQNPIVVTETGKQLLATASERAQAEFDFLDLAILTQIKSGKKASNEISAAVNVRPNDLAMHLFRLLKQGYITYDFRAGNLDIMLTEKGFAQANSGVLPVKPQPQGDVQPPSPQPQAMQVPAAQQPAMQQPTIQQPTIPQPSQDLHLSQPDAAPSLTQQEVEAKAKTAKQKKTMMMVAAAVVLILVIGGGLYYAGII